MPDRTSDAEVKSLLLQSRKFVHAPDPPDEEIRKVVRKAAASGVMIGGKRWGEKTLGAEIRYAIGMLNPSSSPGLPLMVDYDSNKKLIEGEGVEYVVAVVRERLERISMAPDSIFEGHDGAEMLRAGLRDPVRMFVKNELHSEQKIAEGRMRLIMSVSVIDQLCERVVFGLVNSMEIYRHSTLPVKPGMGLHDQGLRDLRAHMARMSTLLSSDMSGWDWNVKLWTLLAVACLRAVQFGEVPKSFGFGGLRLTLSERMTHLLANAIVVASDGRAFRQKIPGVMKSGSYVTSSFNSWARLMLAMIARLRAGFTTWDGMAMGDDCIELCTLGSEEKIAAVYKALGYMLKAMEISTPSNGVPAEFCSYYFHPWKATDTNLCGVVWPVHPWKMAANFLYRWPVQSTFEIRLDALRYELRHSQEREAILSLIHRVSLMDERLGVWGADPDTGSGIAVSACM